MRLRFHLIALGLLLAGAAPAAAQQQVGAQKARAPALVQNAFAKDFPKRTLPGPDDRRVLDAKQLGMRDRMLPFPVKPPPPGAKGLVVPPDARTATRIKSPREAGAVRLEVNRALQTGETQGRTGTVCEPSVAVRGDEVLLTGNWFAASSRDGGQTFTFLNPREAFPWPTGREFECDQVAMYDARHDLMIWILQSKSDSVGNLMRVAVARAGDIGPENWRYYDFNPEMVGKWPQEWFDFPDVAVSARHLYLTTNVYSVGANRFTRSVILRMPLDALASYVDRLDYQYFTTQEFGSFRPTAGATDPMHFFVQEVQGQALRLYAWPDASLQLSWHTIDVDPFTYVRDGLARAPGPDGKHWLTRLDSRLTAAWESRGLVGCAWTVAPEENRPFPYVRTVLVDRQTKRMMAQPHLWHKEWAWAYPAIAPNEAGDLGVSVSFGGGPHSPSHAVGVLRPDSGSGWRWDLVTTAAGTHGPEDGKWGDYLAVRPHGRDPRAWVASGFALRGGGTRTNVEVRYLRFRADVD